jgi:hypothetical protein
MEVIKKVIDYLYVAAITLVAIGLVVVWVFV